MTNGKETVFTKETIDFNPKLRFQAKPKMDIVRGRLLLVINSRSSDEKVKQMNSPHRIAFIRVID